MKRTLLLLVAIVGLTAIPAMAQTTMEWAFNPERTGSATDPFAVYVQNGARGLSGPYDMDRDGKVEFLVAQHTDGGRIHVIENVGPNTWELVYSTAELATTQSANNARIARAGDLDNDGNMEIMYVAGTSYSGEFAGQQGIYVWEHDGVVGSDNYGTRPATVGLPYTVDGVGQANFYADNLWVDDVDGDGQDELLVPANGPSAQDVFYILSVSGTFETDGAGTGFESWVVEGREAPRTRNIGGGSPFAIYSGDFNGDGFGDISYHSWNNFNFFTGTTNGPDTYLYANDGQFVKAAAGDNVALFGGTVVDIDQDGNDEVFYNEFQNASLTVINYDDFENVQNISGDNIGYNILPLFGIGGLDSGDIDQDLNREILAGGAGYSLRNRRENAPSHYITMVEYAGGPVTDGASYQTYQLDTSSPLDTLGFHTVIRDSLGTITKRYELAASKQGNTAIGDDPIFPSRLINLGDPDDDGDIDIAISFQGIDDSLYVYSEVWNADSLRYDPMTIIERMENPVRAFVRVYSITPDYKVSVEDNRIVTPNDYVLSANYPNPFNPTTSFSFTLPVDKNISVRIYDAAGRLVRTLVNNQALPAGTHDITWDGRSDAGTAAASGTYLYTLEYGSFRQSRTMVLVK